MRKSTTWIITAVVAIAIILLVWWIAAMVKPNNNGLSNSNQNYTLNVGSAAGLGSFLVDDRGMTLYYFAKDTIGKSNCSGACLTAWPIFRAAAISVPDQLKVSDFGEITNSAGQKQTTYLGWPLYYYYQDVKAGDVKGEKVGNVWFVAEVPFFTVVVMNKNNSNYLADQRGMTLYFSTNDRPGTATTTALSNCTSNCLANWPAFNPSKVIAPSIIDDRNFSTFLRTTGSAQTAYYGRPLYYYIGDSVSGDTKGAGINSFQVARPGL